MKTLLATTTNFNQKSLEIILQSEPKNDVVLLSEVRMFQLLLDKHYEDHDKKTYLMWCHDAVLVYCICVFKRVGVIGAKDPNLRCIFVKDCSVYEAFNIIIQYIEPYNLLAEKYRCASTADQTIHQFMTHDWTKMGMTMTTIWRPRKITKFYYTPNFEEAMSKTNTDVRLGGIDGIKDLLAEARGIKLRNVWPYKNK